MASLARLAIWTALFGGTAALAMYSSRPGRARRQRYGRGESSALREEQPPGEGSYAVRPAGPDSMRDPQRAGQG
jgi:hypothetical protein